MKYLFFIITICIVICISFNQLDAGQKVKIYLTNGSSITGEIIDSIQGKSIRLTSDYGNDTTYQMNNILKIVNQTVLMPINGSIGFGIGVPYGSIGASFELNAPFGRYSAIGGFGMHFMTGFAWVVGIRRYLLDFHETFQPRLSLLYGINSFINLEDSNYFDDVGLFDDQKRGKGFNLGTGLKWMFGNTHTWGVEVDIYYVINSSLKSKIDEKRKSGINVKDIERFDFSIGLIRSF